MNTRPFRIPPAVPVQYGIATAGLAVFGVLMAAFALPFGRALAPLLLPEGGTSGYTPIQLAHITAYTFAESCASVAVAVAAGLPAAYLVSHRRFWGRGILSACAAIPLCVPALLMALGSIATFGMAGSVNRALMTAFHLPEPPLRFLYSFWGVVITQGFYNFPLVMATVADAWATLDTRLADSARLLGASRWRTFRTITARQLLPSVLSACIPIFLYCFFSFMVVMLFGPVKGMTLEVAVYQAGRSALSFKTAATLALIETLSALGALAALGAVEGTAFRMYGAHAPRARTALSARELVLFCPYALAVLAFFFLPLSALCATAWRSPVPWQKLLGMRAFRPALARTLATATATATACTAAGFVYAALIRLRRGGRSGTLLRTLPLLPMAVSPVVMGLGMTLLVRRGTPLLLVAAQSALSWPFAFRQLFPSIRAIPQDVLDAARTLSPRTVDTVFRILLPCSWRGLLRSFGFCFAISAGDAALPLVLAIPKFDTLALLTFRLAGSYRLAEAYAAGLLLGLICAGVFAVCNHYADSTGTREEC